MSLCQCIYTGTNNFVTENLEKSKTNSEYHTVALTDQYKIFQSIRKEIYYAEIWLYNMFLPRLNFCSPAYTIQITVKKFLRITTSALLKTFTLVKNEWQTEIRCLTLKFAHIFMLHYYAFILMYVHVTVCYNYDYTVFWSVLCSAHN